VASPDNTDLSSGPASAAIAPLWDDWVTDFATSAAGANNDAVLYQLDAPNNRLIIEWNHVRRFGFTAFDDVTFQAILQLNTGALPGTITFNYPDVSIGHAWYDNGADATVGIKPAGAPGFTRLVVEQNNGVSGLVTSSAAVQVAW